MMIFILFYYDVILVSESDTEDQDMAQDQDMSEGEPSEIELSGDEESRDVASRIRDRAGWPCPSRTRLRLSPPS